MKYLAVQYVQEVRDRYGRTHLYFRRAGWPRVKLVGVPGSEAFARSYQAALDAQPVKVSPGISRIAPKSFGDLLSQYYGSHDFKVLDPKTQKNYRAILKKLDAFADLPVASMTRREVLKLRDSGDTISFMRRLKTLMNFAIERDFRNDNPADKVKIIGKRKPFRAWKDADIRKFLAYYSPDSRQNLAITLLLYTGARRSDVVTFGWHNVSGNILTFAPKKTNRPDEEPRPLLIPIHTVLRERIAAMPKDAPAFLMTEYGNPMSEVGFSNWFSESAAKAGLPPRSSPHGLRKAAARRLAEAGCSASQIAAITGHSTLKEVERYTASSDQAKLARSAIRLLDKNDK